MLALRDLDEFKRNPWPFRGFHSAGPPSELSGFAPRTLRALWHARGRINDRFPARPGQPRTAPDLAARTSRCRPGLAAHEPYGVLTHYIRHSAGTGQMQHDLFHVYTVDDAS